MSDIVIRGGAVAGALASIVGLGALLWPDSPGRVAASLENVEVDVNVSLAEFSARQGTADAGTVVQVPRDTGGAGSYTVFAGLESSEEDSAQPAEPEVVPADPPTEAPLEETPPAESEVEPQTDPGTGVGPQLETGAESPVASMSEMMVFEETVMLLPTDSQPDGCDLSAAGGDGKAKFRCENAKAVAPFAPGDVDEDSSGQATVAARDLLKVLRGTRERRLPEGTEPIGVTVNFDLDFEGYEGKQIEVRWSLYTARAGVRVPRDWLLNRRALATKPDAPSQRESGSFWVPLPKQRGPFFVRLTAYDGGKRIARADSKPFR